MRRDCRVWVDRADLEVFCDDLKSTTLCASHRRVFAFVIGSSRIGHVHREAVPMYQHPDEMLKTL